MSTRERLLQLARQINAEFEEIHRLMDDILSRAKQEKP